MILKKEIEKKNKIELLVGKIEKINWEEIKKINLVNLPNIWLGFWDQDNLTESKKNYEVQYEKKINYKRT